MTELAYKQPENFISRIAANSSLYKELQGTDYITVNKKNFLKVPLEQIVFVAIDTEQTWKKPRQLTEVGAVKYSLGGLISCQSSVVWHDCSFEELGPKKRAWWEQTLLKAPKGEIVCKELDKFTRGTVVVEFSGSGEDIKILKSRGFQHPSEQSINLSRWMRNFCTRKDPLSLNRVCKNFSIPFRADWHRALPDAESTALAFIRTMEIGRRERGWKNLGDAYRDLEKIEGLIVFPLLRKGWRRRIIRKSRVNWPE